jgi:hypothetical protein
MAADQKEHGERMNLCSPVGKGKEPRPVEAHASWNLCQHVRAWNDHPTIIPMRGMGNAPGCKPPPKQAGQGKLPLYPV